MKKRYAGSFGLIGFMATLVIGLYHKTGFAEVLERSLGWGAGFAVLGALLGWAVEEILKDVAVEPEPVSPEATEKLQELADGFVDREVEKSPILVQKTDASAEKPEAPESTEVEVR